MTQGYIPQGWWLTLHSLGDSLIGFASDFSAFIVVAALVAAFAYSMGREKLLPLIAAVYAGAVLYAHFPWPEYLIGPWPHLALFGLLVIFCVVPFAQLNSFSIGRPLGLVRMLLLAAVTAGLVVALGVHNDALRSVYTFSPQALALFEPPAYYFGWLMAPLVVAFLTNR